MNQNESALKTVLNFLIDGVSFDELPKADAIFIFGHIDPRVAKHAALLYKFGKSQKIIVSGKGRKEIPEFATEAQYFSDILQKNGVPKNAIILEEKAMNGLENVLFGMEICKNLKFNPSSLILVAVPALLKRCRATFAKKFPNIQTYGSAFEVPVKEWILRKKRLLGEFDRFKEYAKKGDMENIEIPENVLEAIKILNDNLKDQDDFIDSFFPIENK